MFPLTDQTPVFPALKYSSPDEGSFRLPSSEWKLMLSTATANLSMQQVITQEFKAHGWNAAWTDYDNENAADLRIVTAEGLSLEENEKLSRLAVPGQSYVLTVREEGARIAALTEIGALYGVVTFLQLAAKAANGLVAGQVIVDGPDVEKRVISPTLTWYAGYARAGFGMQLWNGERWKEFIDWCLRHKVNALNVVMYGFWPFEFPEYPETVLKQLPVQTWNEETGQWMEVSFTHPNLLEPFLSDLIRYANERGIDIYAYIGLNSYSGGYAVRHPEMRAVLSEELKQAGHVNNYDSLCTSKPEVRNYLIASVKRIEELGFNGLVFEESEEVQWFCQCEDCQRAYGHLPPNEAKHQVSVDLLKEYIKVLNPDTLIGVRWLREPPIVKEVSRLTYWAEQLPERVQLFWTPGLEDDDREFIKWVNIFGRERIYSRNCEGSGFAASLGRIPYLLPDTFPEELRNYAFQHLRNDIAQFQGAANAGCKGINGYGFEWYGHELYFAATAQYGWNSHALDQEEFLTAASRHMFGKELGSVYERIIRTLPCIHETQICAELPSFPFMPNKYIGQEGRLYLERCLYYAEEAAALLEYMLSRDLTKFQRECAQATFLMASRMQAVSQAGIAYNQYLEVRETNPQDRATAAHFADLALAAAEEDYRIIKINYFDSKEHQWTGVAIGEYYIPMVINEYRKRFASDLGEEYAPRKEPAYIVGGESLPWEWLLEWGPKIAAAKPLAALGQLLPDREG
ncbi:glycoside hydrolase family 20 zincin-like fold domain-containing protein [Paenibacillus senegalensis]|uniref:glycoside hydrolase family 20 zincin-like fold domain-containing protein n=1 Tax=Paenibacillus senegalensis TaxID=1465766 RepID=UPI0002899B5A|nr:glycoside hydrolase family 20 zincin-like fold domain-containing protein [Paenibacillus senegalensis]